jgi:membrane protein DedA with SNARE-associated domain
MESYFHYLSHFHYLGLFFLLLLCGAGFPLPEDFVVIAGGYYTYLGHTRLLPTIGVLYAGAVIGDFCLYGIGRRFGSDILAHRRLGWLFSPERVRQINHYFHKYGSTTLFFARFLVGLRSTIFLSAGAFKIPFRKMVLFDGVAAAISIPLITYLAYHFGDELDHFLFWMRRIEHLFLAVAGIFVLFVVMHVRRRLKKKAREDKTVKPEPEEVLEPPAD